MCHMTDDHFVKGLKLNFLQAAIIGKNESNCAWDIVNEAVEDGWMDIVNEKKDFQNSFQ